MDGISIWGRDWDEAVAGCDFALLPLASFEYHGPMAPLGTDPAIVTAIAKYAEKTYRCMAYPPVYYTTCPRKTQGAPTISIKPPTMLSYLIDVLEGIYAAGFSRVLLLNAHDGHMSMARAAAEAIAGQSHTLVVNWWELLSLEAVSYTHLDVYKRQIDYMRVHISQIGGITPARKLQLYCEQYGVRICWHGPGDMSPIAHAANIHIDLAAQNLGIQEWSGIKPPNSILQEIKGPQGALLDVFPGMPEYGNDGYVYASERPGLGVELDEREAAKYPCENSVTLWTQTRNADGSLQAP